MGGCASSRVELGSIVLTSRSLVGAIGHDGMNDDAGMVAG